MIEEAMETAGFWILGCVGTAMVVLGWTIGKKSGFESLPLWQMAILVAAIWGASLYFAGKD